MNMIIRPIENLKKDFDPQTFRVTPWCYNLRYKIAENTPEMFELAQKMASMCDKICVAIFNEDDEKTFALCERIKEGNTVKFLIFNAEEASEKESNVVHAMSSVSNSGHLKYDKYLRFKKGVIS